jgi:transcriptional regulator with XRE-family HTH domain
MSIYKEVEKERLYSSLGAVIRQKRNNAGLTQEDLAVLVDVDRRHIGRIESGQKGPSVYFLTVLAKALNVMPHEFFLALEGRAKDEG